MRTSTPNVTYGEITVFPNLRDIYDNHYIHHLPTLQTDISRFCKMKYHPKEIFLMVYGLPK